MLITKAIEATGSAEETARYEETTDAQLMQLRLVSETQRQAGILHEEAEDLQYKGHRRQLYLERLELEVERLRAIKEFTRFGVLGGAPKRTARLDLRVGDRVRLLQSNSYGVITKPANGSGQVHVKMDDDNSDKVVYSEKLFLVLQGGASPGTAEPAARHTSRPHRVTQRGHSRNVPAHENEVPTHEDNDPPLIVQLLSHFRDVTMAYYDHELLPPETHSRTPEQDVVCRFLGDTLTFRQAHGPSHVQSPTTNAKEERLLRRTITAFTNTRN